MTIFLGKSVGFWLLVLAYLLPLMAVPALNSNLAIILIYTYLWIKALYAQAVAQTVRSGQRARWVILQIQQRHALHLIVNMLLVVLVIHAALNLDLPGFFILKWVTATVIMTFVFYRSIGDIVLLLETIHEPTEENEDN